MQSHKILCATIRGETGEVTEGELPHDSGEYLTARQVSEQHCAPRRGTEQLLLAEDDPGIRRMTSRMLSNLGYRVRAFASGPALLAALEGDDQPADLLLTDFEMPGLTGYELALRLRVLHPNVLTSGWPEQSIAPAQRPADWPRFMSKPFTIRALSQNLRELLDGQPPVVKIERP